MPHSRHPAPERGDFAEEARETLSIVRRRDQTINIVLVAFADGVELEVWADGTRRRRLRFLRDTEARRHFERLCARLAKRGYACDTPGHLH